MLSINKRVLKNKINPYDENRAEFNLISDRSNFSDVNTCISIFSQLSDKYKHLYSYQTISVYIYIEMHSCVERP